MHAKSAIVALRCSEGNYTPTMKPGKVIFVLRSPSHPQFERKTAHLVHRPAVPLYHALAGHAVEVTTLDKRCVPCTFTSFFLSLAPPLLPPCAVW